MRCRGLTAEKQQRLLDYIVVETELARFFARMAERRLQRGDQKRCDRALCSAHIELEVVRRFEIAVSDSGLRRGIHETADEVQRSISSVRAELIESFKKWTDDANTDSVPLPFSSETHFSESEVSL